MKRPTDILRDEHGLILRALESLEVAASRLTANESLPAGWWDTMLAWLGAFADRTHHAKEEYVLFPAMIKAGAPSEGGPIDLMLEEHAEGRALVRAMEQAVPADQAGAARRYVELLRQHIEKENDVLFPLADAVLDEADQQAVGRAFADVAAQLGRDDTLAAAQLELDRLARAPVS
jgi:hemerythrin-like domain-containing protein